MYIGWGMEPEPTRLSKAGVAVTWPRRDQARNNMYYNYYATQVMHHWGGEEWENWNKVMRKQLVSSQHKKDHAAGSWDVADSHGRSGGRLYMTCLCVMTLEVYYRHLPLYQELSSNLRSSRTKKKTSKKSSP